MRTFRPWRRRGVVFGQGIVLVLLALTPFRAGAAQHHEARPEGAENGTDTKHPAPDTEQAPVPPERPSSGDRSQVPPPGPPSPQPVPPAPAATRTQDHPPPATTVPGPMSGDVPPPWVAYQPMVGNVPAAVEYAHGLSLLKGGLIVTVGGGVIAALGVSLMLSGRCEVFGGCDHTFKTGCALLMAGTLVSLVGVPVWAGGLGKMRRDRRAGYVPAEARLHLGPTSSGVVAGISLASF